MESQQVQQYIHQAVADSLIEASVKPSTSRNLDPLSGNQEVLPPAEHNVGEVESSTEGEDQEESYAFDFALVPDFVMTVKQAIAWKEEPSQPLQKIFLI